METLTQPTALGPHLERADATNWSSLKYMGISPLHYLHNLRNPRTDSEALLLGRLTHAMVFEPDQVAFRYITSPRFHKGQNDSTAIGNGYDGGKQAFAAWVGSIGTKEIVEMDLMLRARAMRDAIVSDPVAGPLVTSGHSERRIEWIDASTGILCRGRFDHLNGCLADLKTTRSLVTFERDIAKFGYHSQLAWYESGVHAAGLVTVGAPRLVAVENVPPHDVQVLTFEPDDLAVGRRVYRAALDRLAECRRTGLWPGVSGGVARRVALPAWAGPIEEPELTMDGVPI